jgi:hypothetical protein
VTTRSGLLLVALSLALVLTACAERSPAGSARTWANPSPTATASSSVVETTTDFGQGFIGSPPPRGATPNTSQGQAIDRARGEVPAGGAGSPDQVSALLAIVTSTGSMHADAGGSPTPDYSALAWVVTFHGYCPPRPGIVPSPTSGTCTSDWNVIVDAESGDAVVSFNS